jgi:hypothetical protein
LPPRFPRLPHRRRPRARPPDLLPSLPRRWPRGGRYDQLLAKGRAATGARDYDAADEAFSAAVKEIPHDARATAERGYARMLAGRLEAARADFDAAKDAVSDRVLAGQVWFNIGLLEQQAGDAVASQYAFERSFDANPTAAAKSRLSASTCPVLVRRLHQPLARAAGWLEAWRTVSEDVEKLYPERRPTTDDAAKRLILEDQWDEHQRTGCEQGCLGSPMPGSDRWDLYWELPDGLRVLPRVDRGWYYRCGAPPRASSTDTETHEVVTITRTESVVGVAPGCGPDYCPSFCSDGPWHRHDVVIDKQQQAVVVWVSQGGLLSENHREVEVWPEGTELILEGGTCHRKIELGAGLAPTPPPRALPESPDDPLVARFRRFEQQPPVIGMFGLTVLDEAFEADVKPAAKMPFRLAGPNVEDTLVVEIRSKVDVARTYDIAVRPAGGERVTLARHRVTVAAHETVSVPLTLSVPRASYGGTFRVSATVRDVADASHSMELDKTYTGP